MFENKVYEGIYYSRFIASWYNSKGGKIDSHVDCDERPNDFVRWLKQLTINGKTMSEEEIYDILEMATNGKFELERDCKHFLKGDKG